MLENTIAILIYALKGLISMKCFVHSCKSARVSIYYIDIYEYESP